MVRATVPMHPSDLWVMPSITAVAIDGCLFLTISRQSAQLAQLAASRILQADPQSHSSQGIAAVMHCEMTLDLAP